MRAYIRHLQTDDTAVSPVEKVVRSSLMVPVFSILLVALRIRARLFGPLDLVAMTRTGDRFRCHPPDFIQLYLWLFGVWEPDLTRFIGERLRPGDTFIDVGANIGVFSVLAAKHVGGDGTVVAIEASPPVFTALEDSLALNGHCTNVRCVNAAVGAARGTAVVYSGPDKNTGLTTTVASRGFAEHGVVESWPLDDLLTPDEMRTTRMVKIDVEGAEESVIGGMGRLLEVCPKDVTILIELSPHWWPDQSRRPTDVLKPLLDAGFCPYEMDNNYWPWRYLWPRVVRRPRRCRRDLDVHHARLDLIMARRSGEYLP